MVSTLRKSVGCLGANTSKCGSFLAPKLLIAKHINASILSDGVLGNASMVIPLLLIKGGMYLFE